MGSRAAASLLVLALAAAPAPAAAADKPGSVHVQCDGLPASQGVGTSIAQLVGITLTAGIVGGMIGGPEAPDAGKKQKGAAAVAACEAAIAAEKSDGRRAELQLAKAIHLIDADRPEDAVAAARALPTVSPALMAEPRAQRGAAASALEIEATALARLGRGAEAEALALKMADLAPYDLNLMIRAGRFMGLSPEMTAAKRAFWERATRLYPDMLAMRAEADEWAGDFKGAAEDMEAFDAIAAGFFNDGQPGLPAIIARAALDRWLGGDQAGAERDAAAARKAVDHAVANNRHADSASRGQELLDLLEILRQAEAGKAEQARQAFAARGRWLAPSPPVVAEITRRLRQGAAPIQLTGALARDPAAIRAEALEARARGLSTRDGLAADLLKGRQMRRTGDPKGYARAVWNTQKSPYALRRPVTANYEGEFLAMSYPGEMETVVKALQLHAALLAQARGKTHFVYMPGTRKFDEVLVRYGSPGDPGIPVRGSNEAAQVIAELSPEMPMPAPRK